MMVESEEQGCQVISRFVGRLGEQGFPGFIKVLLVISESADEVLKVRLARCMALLIKQHNIPKGKLSAWGSSLFWNQSDSSSFSIRQLGFTPKREYGPIEYLTVWFSQKTHRPYLTGDLFQDCLFKLLQLFAHGEARLVYLEYLAVDLASASDGAYSRITRQRLQRLLDEWDADVDLRGLVKEIAGYGL